MSKAIDNLQAAQKRAMAIRSKVGGFPYLAGVLPMDQRSAAFRCLQSESGEFTPFPREQQEN